MQKSKTPFYVAVLIEVDTLYSEVVLCADVPQLQMLLDTIDETKLKISVIEVDDVQAFVQWIAKKEELPPPAFNPDEWPEINLN